MLTGREIELGFLRAGYKTHKEMGDSCGLPRLTIFRIIKKGQKPTLEQNEKILSVIIKTEEKQDGTFHNKDPILELLKKFIDDVGQMREELRDLKEKMSSHLSDGDRHSERRREGGRQK